MDARRALPLFAVLLPLAMSVGCRRGIQAAAPTTLEIESTPAGGTVQISTEYESGYEPAQGTGGSRVTTPGTIRIDWAALGSEDAYVRVVWDDGTRTRPRAINRRLTARKVSLRGRERAPEAEREPPPEEAPPESLPPIEEARADDEP